MSSKHSKKLVIYYKLSPISQPVNAHFVWLYVSKTITNSKIMYHNSTDYLRISFLIEYFLYLHFKCYPLS
jgi:hypothetical protein